MLGRDRAFGTESVRIWQVQRMSGLTVIGSGDIAIDSGRFRDSGSSLSVSRSNGRDAGNGLATMTAMGWTGEQAEPPERRVRICASHVAGHWSGLATARGTAGIGDGVDGTRVAIKQHTAMEYFKPRCFATRV